MTLKAEALRQIVEYYLGSPDFNGLAPARLKMRKASLNKVVRELVAAGEVTINFGDRHPNPHIQALEPESTDKQIEKLLVKGLDGACLYPTRAALDRVVDVAQFRDRPFALRLALGEPQLTFAVFDLAVLETYRNDPRYHYQTDDVSGWISVRDADGEVPSMRAADSILLETFGFAYDDELNRAVAVFFRYLADLTPEHQQIWRARELSGNYRLHPDYYRSSIFGEFYDRVSIFEAFLEEMRQINAMCSVIGRPPFFKKVPTEMERPAKFSFLIRPTLLEFQEFVNILDKLLSDNVDVGFFLSDLPLERDEVRRDGRTVTRRKGSWEILTEWIAKAIRLRDAEPVNQMLATFREVRRLRQRPAHAIDSDAFDQTYFQQQRELVVRAYGAVRTLRLLLSNHPALQTYSVPKWLQEGRFWSH